MALLRAASGGDATCAWEYVSHSEHARRILAAHALPELDLEPEGTLRHLAGSGVNVQAASLRPHAGSNAGRDGSGCGAQAGSSLSKWASMLGARALISTGAFARHVGAQALESLLQSGEYTAATHGASTRHRNCLSLLGRRPWDGG